MALTNIPDAELDLLKAGDPAPRNTDRVAPRCFISDDDRDESFGAICTLTQGHTTQHVASGTRDVVAVWPR